MTGSPPAAPAATPPSPPPKVAILVNACDIRLWSVSQEERLRRVLERCGLRTVLDPGDRPPECGAVLLVRTDFVIDEPLLRALVRAPDTLLVTEPTGGVRLAVAAHVTAERVDEVLLLLRSRQDLAPEGAPHGLAVSSPAELASAYRHALRKRAVPYVLALAGQSPIAVEKQMFRAAYKGVTDFVTKWLWPWPAFWATRWCAARGIPPNAVTAASLVLVVLATWLFARGEFGLGIVVAWAMTFLDTVDGKLARVTATSSRVGNVFDHGIDLLHPPFWYYAWYHGLAPETAGAQALLLADSASVVIVGYVAGRVLEGLFLWRFGFEIHSWRPLDSAFRLVTARRNPNLALLTVAVVAGRPDLGLHALALWAILSLAFHIFRFGQALRRRRAGAPVHSWLAEET
jgi:phosphatidylglycerophosphate synthase